MEVVGHQAETEQRDWMFHFSGGKQIQEGAVVCLLVEDGCTAISTIDDVIGEAGNLSTGNARHAGRILLERTRFNRKVACPLFCPLYV